MFVRRWNIAVSLVLLMLAAQTASGDLVYTTSTRTDGATVVRFTGGNNDSWTVPADITSLEVLVVGGGGGGAVWSSGAGAGGYYYTSSYSVTAGSSLLVTVGAGGAAGGGDANGQNGSLSQFDALIAYGGYHGGGYTDGGDQGGYSTDTGGSMIPGNPGGDYAPFDGNWCSGGGAGHAGYKGDNQHGGDGLANAITGTLTYYAGGGGANSSGVNGGGLGGGGGGPTGPFGPPAGNGVPNTGGGAGGGWGGPGGTGGSGVVIVAYGAPVIVSNQYWAPADGGGGAGPWDASTNNWAPSEGVKGSNPQATDNTLIFSGAKGQVTVNGTVMASQGLTIKTDGYQFTSGSSDPNINLAGATAAANTITANSGVTATISVPLTGAGGMTKAGPGVLVVASANLYTGGTTIAGGTLQLRGAGTLGDSTGPLGLPGTAVLDLNGTAQQVGGLSGGANSAILSNGSGTAGLAVNSATIGEYAGTIADNLNGGEGKVALAKSGSGRLTLSGTNTFSGGVTLNGGELAVGNNSLGTGTLTINGGWLLGKDGNNTLTPNNPMVWNENFSLGWMNFNTGTGDITLNKPVTVTAYHGVIVPGKVSGPGGLNALDVIMNVPPGTNAGLDFSNPDPITLRPGGQTVTVAAGLPWCVQIDGVIQGTGGDGLTKAGPGGLNLTAMNAYTGDTIVDGGTLSISQPYLSDTAAVKINMGAKLHLGFGGKDTVGSLYLNNLPMGNGTYNATDPAYGSYFDGPGSLFVSGPSAGVWTGNAAPTTSWSEPLNWSAPVPGMASSYDMAEFPAGLANVSITLDVAPRLGSITINSGDGTPGEYAIAAGGASSITLGGAAPTINVRGGTKNSISAGLTLEANASVDASPGTLLSILGNISGAGMSLTKTGEGALALSGSNDYTGGTVVSGGTLRIDGRSALPEDQSLTIAANGTLVLSSGLSMAAAGGAGVSTAAPVPEPGSVVLLTAALAGWAAGCRRRNRKDKQ